MLWYNVQINMNLLGSRVVVFTYLSIKVFFPTVASVRVYMYLYSYDLLDLCNILFLVNFDLIINNAINIILYVIM